MMDRQSTMAYIKEQMQEYAEGFFIREHPKKAYKLAELISYDGFDMTDWIIHEIDQLTDEYIVTFINKHKRGSISFVYTDNDQKWHICYFDATRRMQDASCIAEALSRKVKA